METAIALLSSLYPDFVDGLQGYMLFFFRAFVGFLFILHGLPKLQNLKTWSDALGAPLPLCFCQRALWSLAGLA